MNKRKSNLDEMQEQKLLIIERNACWLAFFGLFVALMIQLIVGGENLWHAVAGEWALLLCLSVYITVDCIKNGIWSRCYEPSLKTNGIGSIIAGVISGIVIFAMVYMKRADMLAAAIAGLSGSVFTFIVSLLVMSVFGSMHKNRLKKLEEEKDN